MDNNWKTRQDKLEEPSGNKITLDYLTKNIVEKEM